MSESPLVNVVERCATALEVAEFAGWSDCDTLLFPLLSKDIPELVREFVKMQSVLAHHDICSDPQGAAAAERFARGCEAEQKRISGCSPPPADENAYLRRVLVSVQQQLAALFPTNGTQMFLPDESYYYWDSDARRELIAFDQDAPFPAAYRRILNTLNEAIGGQPE